MNIRRYYQFLPDRQAGVDDAKLRFRVKWNGEVVAFSVGYRVDVLKWSPETQRCKSSTTHSSKKIPASVINREIQKYEAACDSVFSAFERDGKMPTAPEFRDAFNRAIGRDDRVSRRARDKSFFDVWDDFVLAMGTQNSWTKATYTKFGSIRTHLFAFDPGLSLSSLNDQTLQAFVNYLLTRAGLRNTTVAKNVAFVRWFLRWAHHNDFYSGKSHESFRVKLKGTDGNSKEVIYLEWDELLALYDLTFPENKKHLERVRDVFCFCCFSSLRYSDVKKLRRSDIRGGVFYVVTQKTADALAIDLNEFTFAILEKYRDVAFPDDLALPVISNAKMNEYLKDLGDYAGLDAPQRIVYFIGNTRHEEVYPKHALLSTHCGRRTFIVNALFLGIPAEVVMKWTGHSDFKAMKPYIKIVDRLKAAEMSKFKRPDLVP